MASHAWLITLRDLPDEGRAWDVDVPAAELERQGRGRVAALSGMIGDLHWRGEIRRRGEVWRLVGRWDVRLRRRCDRCLDAFGWAVAGEVERSYRIGRVVAEDEGDDEALPYPGEIDLIDVLREEVWLAWRPNAICRDDCRGLCPHCGANRNESACGCAEESADNPFAVLKRLKLDA